MASVKDIPDTAGFKKAVEDAGRYKDNKYTNHYSLFTISIWNKEVYLS